jgi:hypothetical protein
MGDKQRIYTFLDGDTLTKIDEKAGDVEGALKNMKKDQL